MYICYAGNAPASANNEDGHVPYMRSQNEDGPVPYMKTWQDRFMQKFLLKAAAEKQDLNIEKNEVVDCMRIVWYNQALLEL